MVNCYNPHMRKSVSGFGVIRIVFLIAVITAIGISVYTFRDQKADISQLKENALIELDAVRTQDPSKCANIKGDSVTLDEFDAKANLPEDLARTRCSESARQGKFLSKRIENLLEGQLN